MSVLLSLEQIQAQRTERLLKFFSSVTERLGGSVPPIVNLDHLRACPIGSLGHAWATHLDGNELQPLDQGLRRQQLHDGIHVLTGYATDLIGEAEVQAFLLGAKFRPIHVVILLGALGALKRQRQHRLMILSPTAVRSHLNTAYHLGKTAQFDPDTWQPENLWDQPLNDVREMFGIKIFGVK